MQKSKSQHASWQELLAAPSPASHVAQISESDDFLVSAVAFFAAEGLNAGEAVQLTGTPAHLRAVHGALAAAGADPDAAVRREQLALLDVHHSIAAVRADGRLDAARFEAVAGEGLRRAQEDARFSGARWWGEISNVMQEHGEVRDALAAEDLGALLGRRYGVSIFCSYRLDRFDPVGYDGILREVCCRHSHVIPAEDYVRHRLAVNRAIAEVIGDIRGPLLQSLLSWKGLGCELPSSQALLFWLRDTLPEHFQEVLSRAKALQLEERAP